MRRHTTCDTITQEWCTYLRYTRGFSQHTVRAYVHDISDYLDFAIGEGAFDASAVTARSLRAWLGKHVRDGASRTSVARYTASIRLWCQWLRRTGRISGDPAATLHAARADSTLPQTLTREAIDALLADLATRAAGGDAMAIRDRAIAELLYSCGLRISELATLNVTDIDHSTRSITVHGKGGKDRVVPYGTPAQRALDEWLSTRADIAAQPGERALFLGVKGRRIDVRVVRDRIERACVAAHVPVVSPHAIRHTAATHMVEGGADLRAVQDFLGHSSLATTQRYTHVDATRLSRIVRQAHPRAARTD